MVAFVDKDLHGTLCFRLQLINDPTVDMPKEAAFNYPCSHGFDISIAGQRDAMQKDDRRRISAR